MLALCGCTYMPKRELPQLYNYLCMDTPKLVSDGSPSQTPKNIDRSSSTCTITTSLLSFFLYTYHYNLETQR